MRITQELERLASYAVTSQDKLKRDNELLLRQGLDLNAIMREKGLDFDLMEQMEMDHRMRLDKLKQMTATPVANSPQVRQSLGSSERLKFQQNQRTGCNFLEMDRVTEEPDTASPNVSEIKRRNNTTDHSIRASVRISKDEMKYNEK